jgi:MYXO-CTERM domain-containing protein
MLSCPTVFGTPSLRTFLVFVAAAGAALSSPTLLAHASDGGPPPPDLGHCPPLAVRLWPNGEVPANFGGLVVTRASGAVTAAELRVARTDLGPTPLAFTVTAIDATSVRVQITDPLEIGARIEVSAQPCADQVNPLAWTRATLYIIAAAPAPIDLGTLLVPTHSYALVDGTTWYQLSTYEPSPEALPWQSAYWGAVEIDGALHDDVRGLSELRSFVGPPATEILSVACPGSPPGGLAPGAHTFRLVAGAWGELPSAYTPLVAVTLDCPPAPPPESLLCIDMGVLPDGASTEPYCPGDAGPPPPYDPLCFDGGGCLDGGPRVDGGEARQPTNTGCTVAPGASGGPSGFGAAFALLALAGAIGRAKRRAA